MGRNDQSVVQISDKSLHEKMTIAQSDVAYHQKTAKEREDTRKQKKYVMTQDMSVMTDDVRTSYQKKRKIASIRDAIRSLFSSRKVYSKYEAAVASDKEDESKRKIDLHHAMGTKLMNQNIDVLEFDLAGSSFDHFRKEYTGLHGKDDIDAAKKAAVKKEEEAKGRKLTKAEKKTVEANAEAEARAHLKEVYGDLTDGKLTDGRKFKYTVKRKQSTDTSGRITAETMRYGIAGPGAADIGTYKISNTSDYVFALAKRYIRSRIDRSTGTLKHDLVINIQGHSRGAVASTLAVKQIEKWIAESRECAAFRDKIKINMILRDPVAGLDSENKSAGRKKIDFRGKMKGMDGKMHPVRDPRLNITSMVSFHADRGSTTFTPQEVRGQSRIVLMGEKHGVTLDSGDGTQTDAQGNQKWHQLAGIDASTMQAYRGSGYSELRDGVWLMDENNTLVRMRSYGEAMELLRRVTKDAKGNERARHKVVANMIKNWFIDNEFVDENMSAEEYKKDLDVKASVENTVLGTKWGYKDSAEMAELKKSIKGIKSLWNGTPKDEEEFEAKKRLIAITYFAAIENCKAYMEKKNNPSTDKGKAQLENVSRLLTFYREDRSRLFPKLRTMKFSAYKLIKNRDFSNYKNWLA